MGKQSDKIQHVKKASMLKALKTSLGVVTAACDAVDIDRSTHYQWLKDDPLYSEKVAGLADVALDFVETQLFKQIQAGDNAPTIFFLKTRGRDRGYIEKAPDNSDNIALVAAKLDKLTPEELSEFDRLNSKLGS